MMKFRYGIQSGLFKCAEAGIIFVRDRYSEIMCLRMYYH